MINDREIKLEIFFGLYMLLLYVMCYFLLYTYSFIGIDILFPYYIFVYGGLLTSFLVLYNRNKIRFSDEYNKTLLIVFSLLPIIIVTSMFLEPMTTGAVLGAKNGFQELGKYLEHVPWMVFKDHEISNLYIKIPSVISLASAIFIFFEKRSKVLTVMPVYIFMYILCLIPYLLWVETLIDCGV